MKTFDFVDAINSKGEKKHQRKTRSRIIQDEFDFDILSSDETDHIRTVSSHLQRLVNLPITVIQALLVCGLRSSSLFSQILYKWLEFLTTDDEDPPQQVRREKEKR